VDQARDELVERRRDRRQAEILQAAAARKEEKRQLRRDQNRTDDWFQSRSGRGKRRR
jgi:flagellar biosynthesis chaperone FliJ